MCLKYILKLDLVHILLQLQIHKENQKTFLISVQN